MNPKGKPTKKQSKGPKILQPALCNRIRNENTRCNKSGIYVREASASQRMVKKINERSD